MARRRDEEDDDYEEEEEEYEGGGKAERKRSRSDFIDEDEDEEEDDYGSRKSNKKRSAASHFFDLEAAVDSDEEEEEEDGEDDFIVDGGADIDDEYDSRQIDRRPNLVSREEEEEDFEALERSIQARYARSSDVEYEEASDDVDQQALLPCVRDPKLWMVKCAIGREREVAVCLMQKCIDRGSQLQIRSVIALDHLKNYIYIEADKEAHVREACKNMRMIYPAKLMLVPIKEMSGVLSVESKAVDLARDTWVRIKTGAYKGDLAKIADVDNVKQRVTVKLIPRIDLQALANKLEGREVPNRKGFIPPPRLMNIDEAREMKVRVERRRNPITGDYFEKIGGMMFKDGFLYKTMAMKSISTQNIEPTFDELEKFPQPGESDIVSIGNRKKGQFMKGDRVIVVKGELKNLKGWVEKVEENIVHIRPKEKNLHNKTLVSVGEKEVFKYFEAGNHVKVVCGASEGTTGMVASVEGHMVNLVSDTTKEIIRVFADTVVESSEVISGATRIGDYELHDLVLLDDKSFGMIIRVESEAFQVLKGVPKTEKAEVAVVRLREIKGKVEKKGRAQDRYQNALAVKDVVRVLEGPFKGKQGLVEHIYRGIVFIYDRHHLEHAGFICANAQSCVLVGGSRANGDTKAHPFSSSFRRVPQSSMRSYRGGPPKNCMSSLLVGGRHGHNNALIGGDVKIRVGPFKGCKGRVVNLKGSSVLVELEAQMKVVTVDRGHLMENVNVRTPFSEPSTYGFGSETPSYPSRTPLHPCMTPMRDPGAATPIHDGMRTPMRDIAR